MTTATSTIDSDSGRHDHNNTPGTVQTKTTGQPNVTHTDDELEETLAEEDIPVPLSTFLEQYTARCADILVDPYEEFTRYSPCLLATLVNNFILECFLTPHLTPTGKGKFLTPEQARAIRPRRNIDDDYFTEWRSFQRLRSEIGPEFLSLATELNLKREGEEKLWNWHLKRAPATASALLSWRIGTTGEEWVMQPRALHNVTQHSPHFAYSMLLADSVTATPIVTVTIHTTDEERNKKLRGLSVIPPWVETCDVIYEVSSIQVIDHAFSITYLVVAILWSFKIVADTINVYN